MIGGLMKTTSRLTLATAFAAFAATGALAADLGGNCCSDLEERVAELEATTARKGNRKVSLQVSGHVHQAIMLWDVDDSTNADSESNVYMFTHNSSRSRFRFKGSAKIDSDWSAGFLIEIGVRANNGFSLNQSTPNSNGGLDIRHEALYFKSKRLGTVWLGKTSSAVDGITEICLGCSLFNSPDWSDDLQTFRVGGRTIGSFGNTAFRFGGVSRGGFIGDGDRREMVRYISPEVAGFVASAAAGQDDFWDVALRYANEFNGVRIAAGVGYQVSKDATDGLLAASACADGGTTPTSNRDCRTLGMSASVQHVATGLYLAGAYGQAVDDLALVGNGDEAENWHITAGVKRKLSPIGTTNFWGAYTHAENRIGYATGSSTELTKWGFGIDQAIDAAAMQIYIMYYHTEADNNGAIAGLANGEVGSMDAVTVGSRIRF